MVKQSEEVAHSELVGGGVTLLHDHPGGGGGGPAEKGIIVTDGDGLATVNFVGSYPSKPVVSLTPEYSADGVIVQIDGWIEPPYTGMVIKSVDDGGKKEGGVPVHWLIWT